MAGKGPERPEECRSAADPEEGPGKDDRSHARPDDSGALGGHPSEALIIELYQDLRKIAAGKMAREKSAPTLQSTALVHEAWLRLGDQKFQNRTHFIGAAAEAMRRILVERARRRGRQKHGGGLEQTDFEDSWIAAPVKDEQLLEVHEVLDRFAAEDPVKAEMVKLRFFAGMTHGEIANLHVISEKTVRRHWQVSKIRLFQLINEG